MVPLVLLLTDRCLTNLFDCHNLRNTKEHLLTKAKPFLKPYQSETDERFTWLVDTFLKYLSNWKQSIDMRPGNFTDHTQKLTCLFHGKHMRVSK